MGLDVYLYNGDLNLHFCDTPETPKDEHGFRDRKDWFNCPERVHAKSQKHPEHLCERTYLRSSYNDSGFNSVVRDLLGRDWYQVFGPFAEDGFGPPDDEGDDEGGVATKRATVEQVKAELRPALERARQMTADLKAVKRPLSVMTESPTLLGDIAKGVESEQAVAITNREFDRGSEGGYSNRDGVFFLESPLKVVAVVRGTAFGREPALHLVYERDLTWYIEACEIAEEFIEYALTLNDPRISWSS